MKSAFVTGPRLESVRPLSCDSKREGWQAFADVSEQAARPSPVVRQVERDRRPVRRDRSRSGPGQQQARSGERTRGTLDLLINNAGYRRVKGVIEAANMTEYRVLSRCTSGDRYRWCRRWRLCCGMRRERIVNTGSSSVYMTVPMYSAYPSSKVALKTVTKHPQLSWRRSGSRSPILEPGGVDTAMVESGPQVEERQWATISENLREQYRQHFRFRRTVIGDNFHVLLPPMVRRPCMEDGLSARSGLKPSICRSGLESGGLAADALLASGPAGRKHLVVDVQQEGGLRDVACNGC